MANKLQSVAAPQKPLSFGEQAVGITFNPDQRKDVVFIKECCASMIDYIIGMHKQFEEAANEAYRQELEAIKEKNNKEREEHITNTEGMSQEDKEAYYRAHVKPIVFHGTQPPPSPETHAKFQMAHLMFIEMQDAIKEVKTGQMWLVKALTRIPYAEPA